MSKVTEFVRKFAGKHGRVEMRNMANLDGDVGVVVKGRLGVGTTVEAAINDLLHTVGPKELTRLRDENSRKRAAFVPLWLRPKKKRRTSRNSRRTSRRRR